MKCTKASEAFLPCEEILVVAFVEKNTDVSFESLYKKKWDNVSKLLPYFFRINL